MANETKLTINEFENQKLTKNTIFKVTYHEMGGVIKYTKFYKEKEKVRTIFETPFYENIEIFLYEGTI